MFSSGTAAHTSLYLSLCHGHSLYRTWSPADTSPSKLVPTARCNVLPSSHRRLAGTWHVLFHQHGGCVTLNKAVHYSSATSHRLRKPHRYALVTRSNQECKSRLYVTLIMISLVAFLMTTLNTSIMTRLSFKLLHLN